MSGHFDVFDKSSNRVASSEGCFPTFLGKQFDKLVQADSGLSFSEAFIDGHFKVNRISAGDGIVSAYFDSFVQLIHVLAPKWRLEAAELVHYAPERPDVTLSSIALVIPDLRGSIVGSASLRLGQALSQLPSNIKVAQKRISLFREEDICGFNVTMDDTHLVQTVKSLEHLCPPLPYLIFPERLGPSESVLDFIGEISSGCQFHDEGQFSLIFFEDDLPVLYDVGVVN